jgi:GNAT superfamily N-acetyltransferase
LDVAQNSVTLDPARRDEAIAAGWRAYADQLPGHEAAYRAACERWQVVAVVADEVIGALFVDGGVIHLGIVPEWRRRWASRRLLRQMLSYGKRTEVLVGDSQEFIERIGKFEPAFRWQLRERSCQ